MCVRSYQLALCVWSAEWPRVDERRILCWKQQDDRCRCRRSSFSLLLPHTHTHTFNGSTKLWIMSSASQAEFIYILFSCSFSPRPPAWPLARFVACKILWMVGYYSSLVVCREKSVKVMRGSERERERQRLRGERSLNFAKRSCTSLSFLAFFNLKTHKTFKIKENKEEEKKIMNESPHWRSSRSSRRANAHLSMAFAPILLGTK